MSTVAATTLHLPTNYPPVYSYRPTGSGLPFKAPEQSRAAKNPALFLVHEQLGQIANLPANWDGHGSAQPDPSAIEAARQLIEDAYQQTQVLEVAGWQRPHISASESGEIVFEWWNANRKLTVYVALHQVTYIKSWGPHILNDMEDGVLQHENFPLIWSWLFA